MGGSRKVLLAWVISGGAAIVAFITQRPPGVIFAGMIFLMWGVAVASNYRGLAEVLPRRFGMGPFWMEQSRGQTRLTFAFFAVFGLTLVVTGLHRLN